MFGLGFWEIVVIFVVLIIFIDPKEIPVMLRKLGRLYGEVLDFNKDVNKMLKDIETDVKEPLSLDDLSIPDKNDIKGIDIIKEKNSKNNIKKKE